MKKNKHTNAYFISGAAITVLFIILMLIGLIHTPYDPNAMNGAEKFSSPSFSHIMGTDNFGRDIFSRLKAQYNAEVIFAKDCFSKRRLAKMRITNEMTDFCVIIRKQPPAGRAADISLPR